MTTASPLPRLGEEYPLVVGALVAALAIGLEHQIEAWGQVAALIGAAVLVGVIVTVAMRVAHHAEALAHRVGEPYGTMILTLSAVAVEVIILAILMTHAAAPTLVRDTIYSAVMLDINGLLGLA